jgi:Fungal Zn(2)-Cys(6) binuclear cluster domain
MSLSLSSRGRKIRCDGAKPVCFHCSQRDGAECSYDALPKRRGPDRVQGARTRGTRSKEDGEPRRRRRLSTTVEQAAGGGSYGIRRPSVTTKPSTFDTLADTTIFAPTQQSVVSSHAVGCDEFDLLEGNVQFNSIASSNQILVLESTSHEHPVSDLVSSW